MNENDDIELDLMETNELIFNVKVEGSNTIHESRLQIRQNDISYTFHGTSVAGDEGNVSFMIPESLMKEGTYESKVEVIVGNKILVPLKFNSVFKQALKSSTELIEANVNLNDSIVVEAKHVINKKHVSANKSLKERFLSKKSRQPVIKR